MLAYTGVTRVSRIALLTGALWALGTASSCIWPQPVNEEPPPPAQTDVAPTITSVSPPIGPLQITSPTPNHCDLTIYSVAAKSPLGRRLTLRFYLNYLNGPANPSPIKEFDMQGALSPLPSTQTMGPNNTQVFTLQQLQGQLLLDQPNSLWIWVSDGFADPDLPTAKDGYYATSFSWTFDLAQCPSIN